LGLWQPDQGFEYALTRGGFNSESYIKFMDWIAKRAAQTLAQRGRITVAVEDNGSLHTSLLGSSSQKTIQRKSQKGRRAKPRLGF